MKAMILAGGVGSRLRPMTCTCPKPMAPVLGRPVMEYAVQLLKRHGVREIGVTTCYRPEMIREYFGDGTKFGVSMRYFQENEPLGTAGGVAMAREFLDEPFFVLSGDGLTDCDLTAALDFHRKSGAQATIVLRETEIPTEYGVALINADGRIRNFLEKPDWSDVFSDLANTGIYILEPEVLRDIPPNAVFDFSRDLFPKLMASKRGVYGYVMRGYWCDIGDTASYLGAHRAFLQGEIDLDADCVPGEIFVDETAKVDGGAVLEAPCAIGPGAVVERGAFVGAGTFVGKNAHVGARARLKRAVLWHGASVGAGAKASGAVLCEGAALEKGAQAFENSVVGSFSVLGEGAVLSSGAKIWPEKAVPGHGSVAEDLVWGKNASLQFRGGWLKMRKISQALRFGEVFADFAGGPVLLARDAGAGAQASADAVRAGLTAGNRRVLDAGNIALPAARFLCGKLAASAGIYCTAEGVLPMDRSGGSLSRADIRKLERAFLQERLPRTLTDIDFSAQKMEGGALLYIGDIAEIFSGGARQVEKRPVALYAPRENMLALAQQAIAASGRSCRAEWDEELMALKQGEFGLWLDGEGKICRIADETGALMGEELATISLWAALEDGERRISLPKGASDVQKNLLQKYGAQEESGERQPRAQWDGVFAGLRILAALERRNFHISDWRGAVPQFAFAGKTVSVETGSRARLLRELAREYPDAELGDGVRIRRENARIWVRPSCEGEECLILCEAMNAETAQDLLGEYAAKVLRTAQVRKNSQKN